MEICIIKLGADGDVLRTLPIARAIKKKHPEANLHWITKGDIASIVALCDDVDRVAIMPYKGRKEFDIVYNFDVDKEALSLMAELKAGEKYGFGGEGEYPEALNTEGEYYINTMFDDKLKKGNKKTYQEMMFNAAELEYTKENLRIELPKEQKLFAKKFRDKNELSGKKIIGIHMGASKRWPSKVWHKDRVKEFITRAAKEYEIILFGGPGESKEHEELAASLTKEGVKILRNNPENTKLEFLALVNLCDIMICSDSFALHASLLLGKKTIVLFFCTSPDEVEGYGLLHKMVAKDLYEVFPEKSDMYHEALTKSISEEEILDVVNELSKHSA